MFRKLIRNPFSLFKKNEKQVATFPKTSSSLDLHDVLKNSYDSADNQAKFGVDKGYVFDKDLSNHNQQVYYHPVDKKLLVSVAGTHNAGDILTDVRLMGGGLKNTSRYKEAENTLNSAKTKYGVDNALIAGHSLGGSIGSYIGGGKDKVYTLDKGQTIGNRNNVNENAFRSAGDVVSLLGANKMTTIGNGPSSLIGGLMGALKSHDIGNIKGSNIFV